MSAQRPKISVGCLVSALLSGSGPDRALDALLHLLVTGRASPSEGLCPMAAARMSLGRKPPSYTAEAGPVLGAARTKGIITAVGRNTRSTWASMWLPAPHGDHPLIMFAEDQPRAAAAALAESFRLLGATRA